MPNRPGWKCNEYTCKTLVYETGEGYCAEHKHIVFDKLKKLQRKSAAKRGYDRKWQRIRASYLRAKPFCVTCQDKGKMIQATDVDHIVPHRGSKALFYDFNNLQGLCHRCHSVKTLGETRERRA